jgi:phosphatidylglycerophosphatase A
VLFIVSGAGVGYSPYFPGTMGTLLAIPISIGFNRFAAGAPLPLGLLLAVLTVGAISISTKAAELLKQKDPQVIVIDEVIGFMIANFLAPARLAPLILSFLLFRFFDIGKIFPAARLEKLPGGTGIVLDDVMAGVYAFVLVQSALHWELI